MWLGNVEVGNLGGCFTVGVGWVGGVGCGCGCGYAGVGLDGGCGYSGGCNHWSRFTVGLV